MQRSRIIRLLSSNVLICLLAAVCAAPGPGSDVAPRQDYIAIARALEPFIEHELREKELPAISVALVDDQQIVWARGFGFADPEKKIPATAQTVYRVGSVSKLFTDIGVMQLVERGELKLDAPISDYLPDFQPGNPFHKPITLRELMSHRSGLVREPPVGHYFDPTEPTVAATVKSLSSTALVYEPGTHTKYSNAGITVVGYVLEQTKKEPYAKYLKRAVLQPMGLGRSAFEPESELVGQLAKAYMWTYDGRTFEAPTFQLGIGPAGCLYTTVLDLGRFLSVLFARGRSPQGTVLKPETLERMWQPQFSKPGETSGFGIGFRVNKFEGHRLVGHGGAIYGFATEVLALPDDKLGVVVVTTMDSANAVTGHIAREALRLMLAVKMPLAAKSGKPLPRIATTTPLEPALARKLDGRYGEGAKAIDLIDRDGKLYHLPVRGGERVEMRRSGDALMVDGKLAYGATITPEEGGVRVGTEQLKRVTLEKPAHVPARWRGVIGEYGWDHDTLYVLERDGKLTVLIEWYDYYPLEEVSANVFRFPKWGLYDGETLTFNRGQDGRATEARVSDVVFKRRQIEGETSASFHITPLEPVDTLRKRAMATTPPVESGDFRKPDLVELVKLDSTIKLDIRYATTNNFMRTIFYPQARAFMQRPAAEALVRAHQKLKTMGYGLLIHDSYRPWYVTKMFWDGTSPDKRIFVANPNEGSRHNRGCAVDLTLYDLETGRALAMGGLYDEMSERSYPDYPGGTSLERWQRLLLRHAMEEQGFSVYPVEWWHFDYKDWAKYPILNVTAGSL